MRWPEHIKVAVNLSSVQFKNRNLSDSVMRALRDTGLAPHRLELEITESVLLQDSEGTLETLRRLRNMGIAVSMDDFGTGYSSLSYLQKFPFDKIKSTAASWPTSPPPRRASPSSARSAGSGARWVSW
jgi:EAL domain-containing protein (putative c-di-GMP-specific phosphodiesterase class I)